MSAASQPFGHGNKVKLLLYFAVDSTGNLVLGSILLVVTIPEHVIPPLVSGPMPTQLQATRVTPFLSV